MMFLYIIVVLFVFSCDPSMTAGTTCKEVKDDGSNNSENYLEPTSIEPLQRRKRLADEDEIYPCLSETKNVSLQTVKHEGKWRTVVTIPSIDFVQNIRTEICLNPGKPCPGGIGKLPGIESRCKQMFTDFTVLVMKGSSETEIIKASIPTYCACSIEPTAAFNCVMNLSQSCSQIDQLPGPHNSSDVIRPVSILGNGSSVSDEATQRISNPSFSLAMQAREMLSLLAFSLTFVIYVGIA